MTVTCFKSCYDLLNVLSINFDFPDFFKSINVFYCLPGGLFWLSKRVNRSCRIYTQLLISSIIQWTAGSDKVYQLLAHVRWFSAGTPASSTAKTGRHDIAEIMLKVALNTINKSINQSTSSNENAFECCISFRSRRTRSISSTFVCVDSMSTQWPPYLPLLRRWIFRLYNCWYKNVISHWSRCGMACCWSSLRRS